MFLAKSCLVQGLIKILDAQEHGWVRAPPDRTILRDVPSTLEE